VISQCKNTQSKTIVKKLEVSGDLKVSGAILEASGITVKAEDSVTYQVGKEEVLAKNESQVLVGLTVQVTVTVDHISVTGDSSTAICVSDLFTTTKPITNTYLLEGKSRTNWIECNLLVKRQVAEGAEQMQDFEDFCYYINPDGTEGAAACVS